MEFSQELKQSLGARELNGIRAALIGYLDLGCEDDAITVADEVEKQLSSSGIALFDEDDGRDTTGAAKSPREALRRIRGSLRLNFSREKIRRGAELKRLAETSSETVGGSTSENTTVTRGGTVRSSVTFGVSTTAGTTVKDHRSGDSGEQPGISTHTTVGAVPTRAAERAVSETSDPVENRPVGKEVVIPADLKQAVANGETSSVRSMLIGFLDVFDKTEPVPVIELVAYCKDNLEKRGIRLFDEDDKRVDFSAAPLTAETLRMLKGKLRLNFSLEKMIFAERIFQQELAKKLQQTSPRTTDTKPVEPPRQVTPEPRQVTPDPRQVAPEPRQAAPEPRQVTPEPRQVEPEPRQAAPEPRQVTPDPRQVEPPNRPRPAYSQRVVTRTAGTESRPRPDNKIKVEIVYKPGPLEFLFGQIGKIFDCLFNKKGKRIERPYRGRR